MPTYESNQTIIGYLRRTKATFDGFTSKSVSIGGQSVPILHGKVAYRASKVHIALLTRPGDNHDTLIFSLPLFRVFSGMPPELFEQLLSWNNGSTGSAHFAIDELMNSINLVCVRPVEGLDLHEFQNCMDQILNVRLNALNQLRKSSLVSSLVEL
ncbi:MAG TPA: CesT family type III secretion system chaperone [Acidobacteriota bacterium]|nr:CesT family type III secretion system chaperone [Acidobacteriota bacterium]